MKERGDEHTVATNSNMYEGLMFGTKMTGPTPEAFGDFQSEQVQPMTPCPLTSHRRGVTRLALAQIQILHTHSSRERASFS